MAGRGGLGSTGSTHAISVSMILTAPSLAVAHTAANRRPRRWSCRSASGRGHVVIYSCKSRVSILLGLASLAFHPVAQAQTVGHAIPVAEQAIPKVSDADLAKDLQNPVAGVITVPLESRADIGPGSSWRYTLTMQPVLPFELTPDWLLVSRTLLPFVYSQSPAREPSLDNPGESPLAPGQKHAGIGDMTQSFFLVPKEPMGGWIWGAGPVLRLPTASYEAFGQGRWGAGPTAVVLRQDGAWTYGMLANHIWSFAGWGPENVSTTFLQPFLAYTTDALTTFGVGSETGYDWVQGQWVVPVDISVSQLVRIGKLPLQIGLGGRVYAERPAGGPNWGLNLTITFLFPK